MFGSGVKIGLVIILAIVRQILKDQVVVTTESCVVVVGTEILNIVVYLPVIVILRQVETVLWAYV